MPDAGITGKKIARVAADRTQAMASGTSPDQRAGQQRALAPTGSMAVGEGFCRFPG